MLDQQPRYERYKPVDSDWADEVPVDWDTLPIRAVLFERKEQNIGPRTNNILSVVKDVGVIPYDERGNTGNKKSDDIERYKLVYPGDLVLNKMNAIIGSLGVSKHFGAFSQVYIVLRPRNPNFISVEYLGYLFSIRSFQRSLIKISKGIMEIRESIDMDELKKIILPVPDLPTQHRIVRFLDKRTSEIDSAIAKKRRLIDLLNEQKAILINRAVTKGLDPDAPMKDSGVDWIGEIPAHWNLLRNQRFLHQRKAVVGKKSDEFTLLSLTLRGVVERDMENPEGKFPAEFHTYQVVRPGDFVFCHFDVEETPRTVGLSRFHGMITGAYTVYEALVPNYSEYIERLYISLDADKLLRPLYSGLRNTIDKTVFAHTKMPVPPPEEVETILQKINHAETETTKVVSAIEREIAALTEFKQTLTAHAVTGKIKV